MAKIITVTVGNETKEYPEGTLYLDIAREYQERYEDDIVLLTMNGRLRELRRPLNKSGKIEFVTTSDKAGKSTYRRSVVLLMQRAYYNLFPDDDITVQYSVSQGLYCDFTGGKRPDREVLERLKNEMRRLVDENLPINKQTISTCDAVSLFGEYGMMDKKNLFEYRLSSTVNVYSIGHYMDYYYGYMVPSTGYLRTFDLTLYSSGFVLLFPNEKSREVAPFTPSGKLTAVLEESTKWASSLGLSSMGDVNRTISDGNMQNIILVEEAMMERKIGEIASTIAQSGKIKFIMIAGPSSSGKTTFSHRLSIQLITQGMKPHPIPLDNYYVNRDKSPRDDKGNYDFECLESIDVEQFNEDMIKLIHGERVEMPVFNFKTGKREYKGDFLQLGTDDVLVIEGIHGLNDKLSHSLAKENKFKIYISALTQLNIDRHNCLHTTDGRLLRRIVRDARTRNTSAKETIAMWDSVRRGEERYIFPFQESADMMFNSAFVYEMSVLKAYVEPLLYQIGRNEPEYLEAKRLLKLLSYMLPLPSEPIVQNSLFREFIGGSCFNV